MSRILFASIIGTIQPLFAQDVIEPRPIPEPTAEQREINRALRPRNHCSRPFWPDAAVASQQEGWVVVEITISKEGDVIEPRVFDSSPPDIFDAAALEAISRCLFEPKLVQGESVEVKGVQIRVLFEL